ncbi:endolytic transglycosylase MltG [Pseudogracilibacillus sp. SE30717A]|uniref:endolytic transglycosylase MltG n=1 Tax=Pseudogracilibacillus sp. SE30717A TaxID=3098293 RepID=UPI00300E16E5
MTKDKESTDRLSTLEMRANDAKIVRKIVLIILSSFTLIFVIGIISGYFYVKSAIEPVDPGSKEKIEVEIPMGSSTSEIASILEDNGIIKNSKVFRFYIKFKNHSDFQAGEYTLTPSLSLADIVKELQSGKVMEEPIYRITIPEGKTIEQIADILANKLSFTQESFLKTVNDDEFINELMNHYPDLLTDEVLNEELYMPLEGYLFAGTYDIYEEEPSVKAVIDMMVQRTDQIIKSKKGEVEESGLTVHEILTLASVIERESKFSKDRPKVAQVYFNRIENNMKLQSDITAFYGLKNLKHKAVVTYDDIEVKTPYNTYVVDGLPIGPIDSPSEESIDGVLNPEGKDFTKLYYFSRPNGETFYSDTLDEHNQIKEEYRHEWYELENEKSES